MKTISWIRQCKVSQNDAVNLKKLLFTPLLLILLLSVPASIALADFVDVSLSVSAPDNVVPGETYYVTVTYTNNTGGDIDNVVISTF